MIPTLRCGGAERMVVNLMTHLDKRRFHIGAVILAGAEGGVLEQSVLEAGLQVWHLGKGPGFDPTIPFRIRNIVCQFRPHVVHSHLCLHYAFPLSRVAGTPTTSPQCIFRVIHSMRGSCCRLRDWLSDEE